MATLKTAMNALGGLFDNGNRVYSAINPPPSDWTTEKLAADWTNTTTTETNIFTGFSPATGTDYEIEALLRVITAATGTGFQFALVGAATSIDATDYAVQLINPTTAGGTTFVNPAAWGNFSTATAGMITPNLQRVRALIRTNATSPVSNITVQARSEVASSEVRVKAGSILRWKAV